MDEPNLLLIAFVFLAAAVTVVPLAKRAGLGAVIGYLLAGVVIGPFGFALVDDIKEVMHFAEFGVVMMLFLIGLELDPKTLWRLRRPIAGVGGLQVVITTLLLTAFFQAIGMDWKVSLIVALGLSLSSTAVALQLLQENNQLQSRMGQSTFSVLLFQDIAVIPILATVSFLAATQASSMGDALNIAIADSISDAEHAATLWDAALKMTGLGALLIMLGRYGLPHVFRYITKTRVDEIFTAMVLLIVVGVTLLMEQVGLSAALGAFIAGVILAESDYKHEIERELQPFKALLLGLFFMSVGMSVNFDVITAQPWAVMGLVAGLVIIKFAVCAGIGWFFHLRPYSMIPFALLLAQGGEFAFVVLSLARQVHAIPADTLSLITAVVAISMAVTPLLYGALMTANRECAGLPAKD